MVRPMMLSAVHPSAPPLKLDTPVDPPVGIAWADPAPPAPRYGSVRNRFSLAKTARLVSYCRTVSTRRQVAVVALFAVPSALTSLLACAVPLRAPSPHIADNSAFWLHFSITFLLSYSGTMFQVRAAAAIPHTLYTNRDIALIAVVSTSLLLALTMLTATYWRFPIPFTWVLIMTPWLLCLTLGNVVVLRRRLKTLGRPLLGYTPSLVVQVSQIVIYPAYSALFEAADDNEKIALILFFPVIKFALKRSIFWLTRASNHEFSSEIAVSGVEISASTYQSMIMQTTPSPLATALVIGIDVAHGLLDVMRFLSHHGTVLSPGTDVLAMLERIVDAKDGIAPSVVNDESELTRFGTRSGAAAAMMLWTSRRQASPVVTTSTSPLDEEKTRLTQALEMLQAAETILLVEYLEVVVPLVNALYLAVATQFESALFNPRLRCFYGNPRELSAAIASVVLYTALQAVTLVAMAIAIQRRPRTSALTLLAFVLEGHLWSLQGKMVAWMCVLFVFSVVHYGVDFNFQFDFTSPSSC